VRAVLRFETERIEMFGKIIKAFSVIGPGIFAIGYTIGTGSVTSMAKAGADYGFGLLWVLALSCLFSGVLMTAYGRFAAVTGETSLHGMARFLPGGGLIAALVFFGVVTAQYTCLGGIMILTAGAIKEAFALKLGVFPVACMIMAVMYALMMVGRYPFFEKILAFFVFLMVLMFAVSVFVSWPEPEALKRALSPLLPRDGASLLMLAAFVGTTMAAPTFVTRPLIVREKGWGAGELKTERRDSIVSAALMFVISGSVMAVAAGALFAHGKGIDRILDMAATLEPVAGRFAVALFMVGTLAAGLSSVFPIMMVAPLLIGDWKNGWMDVKSPLFRIICLVAAVWGLVVPALGSNPVTVTIAAQISNVFVLPLTVAAVMWLTNRKAVMGDKRAGIVMNSMLAAAFVFSVAVAYAGVKALLEMF
jgi:Mn2+/Fe2+ NRAMP family transporter